MNLCRQIILIVLFLGACFTPNGEPDHSGVQTTRWKFSHAWGPATVIANNSRPVPKAWTRVITNGKGEPDFLVSGLGDLSMAKKIIRLKIRVNQVSKLYGLELRIGDSSFGNYYAFTVPYFSDPSFNIVQSNEWHQYTFGLANAAIVGEPQDVISKYLGIYVQDNGTGSVIVDIGDISVRDATQPATVSITFDDGYSEHLKAAEIMSRYGLRGTAYVMPREIGDSVYLNLKQLQQLRDKYNWGVSSHHEIPYVDFKPQALEDEIRFTLQYLTDNGFSRSADHLAYPLGRQNREYVLPIVQNRFKTARLAGGGVETLPPADWHLLRTYNVENTSSPHEISEVVKKAKQENQWVILMFHYLVENPRSEFEYAWNDFESVIKLIAESGVKVLPVHEVYTQLRE